MYTLPVHEQLRAARETRGEDLATLARRIGTHDGWLRAIDEGRFADLPPGIYARAAVRRYAGAVGLDPQAVLDACQARLPSIDDPIAALAVRRGVRPVRADHPPDRLRQGAGESAKASATAEAGHHSPNDGRAIAAAAIDAVIIMTAMLTLVAITAAYCRVPASAFGRGSAPAFAIMGALLAASYFLCVGGVTGATLGETIVGMPYPDDTPRSRQLDLRAIGARAWRCACRDIFVIQHAGALVAHLSRRRSLAHVAHDEARL